MTDMHAAVDSDVLIWYLRGEVKAHSLLERLRDDDQYELWIGAMQRAEVVFFMRPSEETATLLFLTLFQTAPADQQTLSAAHALTFRLPGSIFSPLESPQQKILLHIATPLINLLIS